MHCGVGNEKQPPNNPPHERQFSSPLLHAGILRLVVVILQCVEPFLLNRVISSLEDPSSAYIWAAAMFIVSVGSQCVSNNRFHMIVIAGIQAKAAVAAAIYEHCLMVQPGGEHTIGHITNLITADVEALRDCAQSVHDTWAFVLQLVIALGLLTWQVGWLCAAAALLVAGGLVPLEACIIARLTRLTKQMMTFTDVRVGLIHEIAQGFTGIKYAAWEEHFQKLVEEET